ncbi:hypothetical protein G7046_g256 [Stylonectria norvegica]|nr:hypothetical protein G7046_g256 [Stylonectria norvegica]
MSCTNFAGPGPVGESSEPPENNLDPTNIESRRTYMTAFLRQISPCSDEDLEEARQDAEDAVCAQLYEMDLTIAGALFFEYQVDRNIWLDWLTYPKNEGAPTPKWPWSAFKPKLADLGHGSSRTYARWLTAKTAEAEVIRQRQDHSTAQAEQVTATMPTSDFESFSQAWKTIMANVPDCPKPCYPEPIIGEFEVLLPACLSFDYFVLGPKGCRLTRINEDLIPRTLKVTWAEVGEQSWPMYGPGERFSGFSKKLVISERVDWSDADRASLRDLREVWTVILNWVLTVYQSRPVPLDQYLSMVIDQVSCAPLIDEFSTLVLALHGAYFQAGNDVPSYAIRLDEVLEKLAEGDEEIFAEIESIGECSEGADWTKWFERFLSWWHYNDREYAAQVRPAQLYQTAAICWQECPEAARPSIRPWVDLQRTAYGIE